LRVEKLACDFAWMLHVFVLYTVSYIRYFIWIFIRLGHLYKTKKIKMIVGGKRGGIIGERERGVLSSLISPNLSFIFTLLALHIL